MSHLERNVIRKHVLGNFSSMLLGVMQHTAMIVYLDNQFNRGPDSPLLRNGPGNVGINENLAREILELHTVGTENFTQSDVRSLGQCLDGMDGLGIRHIDSNQGAIPV